MLTFSGISTMFRRFQLYLFDYSDPDDPDRLDSATRRRHLPSLSPEQRLRRRKLRERWVRRQKWIIEDAKPPVKRKVRRRKRRRIAARKPRAPRLPNPNRVLKRQYKPLESPLYNLPAGLVDKLAEGKINLRLRKHLKEAHQIADAVARIYIERDQMDPDEVKAMHDAIDRLAENPLPIRDQLADIRKAFEVRAEEVQNGWSDHHRNKVNNYFLPPLEVDRVKYDSDAPAPREVIE